MTIPANVLERKGYRLPTEVEWEYACRAGAVTSRYYGVSLALLENYAWYRAIDQERAHPCGGLLPNDLGLFDMLGNVYEWCQDRNDPIRPDKAGIYVDSSKGGATSEKVNRILRGGAYYVGAKAARSADREADSPSLVNTLYGFRLARTLK
jgi:formylglycine-generating enzyme required for sulfatase activity